MKKLFVGFYILLLLTAGGLCLPKYASANDDLPFYVEPIFPDNQDEEIKNYISISPKTSPLKQEIEFLIRNNTKKNQVISIKTLNAYTSTNGVIQYALTETDHSKIIDPKYEMKQYMTAPSYIELKSGEGKKIRVKLDIPNIKGTVLGGIAFTIDGEREKAKTKGISFEIKNEINTIYGIAINFPTEKTHNFEFGKPFLEPLPSYYVVRLPITLNAPLLLKDFNIDYEVKFNGKKLFFSKEKIDFAPMTKTNFSIPFEHKEIEVDKPYNLAGKLTYVDRNGNEQVEEFTGEFVFKKQDESNENAVSKVLKTPFEKVNKSGFPFWMLLLFMIPSIFIIFFIWKKRKKDKEKEETAVKFLS